MDGELYGSASGYVTVEIYDQTYHLSGQDVEHVRALAARVAKAVKKTVPIGLTATGRFCQNMVSSLLVRISDWMPSRMA